VAGWPEPFPSIPKNLDECPPAAYDAKARLAYMDEIGAWAMALYPNIGGFGSETFLGLDDPDLMLACVRAYNDWLIEWISPDPRRFIPVMATPFWDVDATVAEIHRCFELGHRAILFTSAPQDFGMPLIGDPHWNSIWNAAQEVGLPISLHIGSGDFQDQLMNPARFAAHGIGPTTVSGSMSILLANAIQLMDVTMSGILPRNPRLRVVSVESGIAPSSRSSQRRTSWTRLEPIACSSRPTIPTPSASMETTSARRSTRPSAICLKRFATRSSSPTPPSSMAWALRTAPGREVQDRRSAREPRGARPSGLRPLRLFLGLLPGRLRSLLDALVGSADLLGFTLGRRHKSAILAHDCHEDGALAGLGGARQGLGVASERRPLLDHRDRAEMITGFTSP
jgi:predicted TIM-barrel fold metal-dependent hydrolase